MPRRTRFAHDRLDPRLQRRVALGGADRQLEVAVVDRADLDRHGDAVALAMRLAKTGHAQEHSDKTPLCTRPRGLRRRRFSPWATAGLSSSVKLARCAALLAKPAVAPTKP